jgi:hypothetical protein
MLGYEQSLEIVIVRHLRALGDLRADFGRIEIRRITAKLDTKSHRVLP